MTNATNTPDHSRGVGKSGQDLGLENELKLLDCIKDQGWVREYEASLITGMSSYTVGMVSRRLAAKVQIFRCQSKNRGQTGIMKQNPNSRERLEGNAGFFLRLTAAGADRVDGISGKDITIPATWRHHAMAIQTLSFLAKEFNCDFETEASMLHRKLKGKLPDGRLVLGTNKFHFEQERSRKSGPNLRKQTENITRLAATGTTCLVAYPFPAEICGGIDHETRQTNSIRGKWGSPDALNIKLVRCHFDSLIDYYNMRVSRFEIIDLPAMVKTAASQKDKPGVTDQIRGFKWVMAEQQQLGQPLRIEATLRHDENIWFEGTFTEGELEDEFHRLESDGCMKGEVCAGEKTFTDFVLEQQKNIEHEVLGDVHMCEM